MEIPLQGDAFRGHGLSRFVANAPAGSSARAVPAGVAPLHSISMGRVSIKNRHVLQ